MAWTNFVISIGNFFRKYIARPHELKIRQVSGEVAIAIAKY